MQDPEPLQILKNLQHWYFRNNKFATEFPIAWSFIFFYKLQTFNNFLVYFFVDQNNYMFKTRINSDDVIGQRDSYNIVSRDSLKYDIFIWVHM